jgi:hypothetical protein
VRVGDLALLLVGRTRWPSGLGNVALQEIRRFFSDHGLPLINHIANWSEELAADWEKACAAKIEQLQRQAIIDPSSVEGTSQIFLEDELQQLARLIIPYGHERRIRIVTRFLGFDGTGKKTLEEVGNEFGITRERVRQIVQDFKRRIGKRGIRIPQFRWACELINQHLPAPEAAIRQALREHGITAVDFDCSGVLATHALLDEEASFHKVTIGNVNFLCAPETVEVLRRAPRLLS